MRAALRLVAGVLLEGVDGDRALLHDRARQVEARVLVPAARLVEVGVGAEDEGEERDLDAAAGHGRGTVPTPPRGVKVASRIRAWDRPAA